MTGASDPQQINVFKMFQILFIYETIGTDQGTAQYQYQLAYIWKGRSQHAAGRSKGGCEGNNRS